MAKAEWGEFKIGDLFDVESYTKRFDANKVDVLENGNYPYVVRMSSNNGQKGYIEEDEQYLNEGNTISFGQDTATMFYQEKPYFTGDKIKILKAKEHKFGKSNAQFFLTAMSKAFRSFSWGSSSYSVEIIKQQIVSLPITPSNKIDFDFIEDFIAELEERSVAELEAWLRATGFDDCTLTEEEEQAIYRIEKGNQRWAEKKIVNEIFSVQNTHNILKEDVIFGSGNTPYVTASEGNNSVVSYISYKDEMKEEGNSILIGGKTLVITYQPNDFFSNDSHNLLLKPISKMAKREDVELFLVTSLYKSLSPKYSWGNSISNAKIKIDNLNLPINYKGEPDYELMRIYIRAVKKLVIKDVAKYANKKIRVAQQVIAK